METTAARWLVGVECSLLAPRYPLLWLNRKERKDRKEWQDQFLGTRNPKPGTDPVTEDTEGEEIAEGLIGGAVPACVPAVAAFARTSAGSTLQPKPLTSTLSLNRPLRAPRPPSVLSVSSVVDRWSRLRRSWTAQPFRPPAAASPGHRTR